MHWAGTVGLGAVSQAVERYYGQTGREHWSPSSLLVRLGVEEKTFDSYDGENS